MDTEGIETLGRLDGSHPETFPVTFENIPPAALVGLQNGSDANGKSIREYVFRHDSFTQKRFLYYITKFYA